MKIKFELREDEHVSPLIITDALITAISKPYMGLDDPEEAEDRVISELECIAKMIYAEIDRRAENSRRRGYPIPYRRP